jgi:hypothetical protein
MRKKVRIWTQVQGHRGQEIPRKLWAWLKEEQNSHRALEKAACDRFWRTERVFLLSDKKV